MVQLDFLQWYLVAMGVATFVAIAVEHAITRGGRDVEREDHRLRPFPHLLLLAGGAYGGAAALLLFDRHTSKANSARHALAAISVVLWTLILCMVYVVPPDGEALCISLQKPHPQLMYWLLGVSAVTFIAMLIDKGIAVINGRARDRGSDRELWRIPEGVLLGFGLIGGSAAGLLAMLVVRHKIRTPAFYIGLPLMLIVQLAVIAYVLQLGLL